MEDNEDNIFTVTPMSQSISLTPGEVYEGSITVINPSYATSDFNYKVGVTPYGVSGETYVADLLSESDRTAISKWIEIAEPTGTIAPNESREVKFKITVPQNVPAGGQYATIAVSSDNDAKDSGSTVQNVFEIASIIYADVAGETIHGGEILENNIPAFALTNPVIISALLTNTGNIHENAIFTITATDLFTGNVILPTEEVTGRYSETIMPETTRYVERELKDFPAIGVVKVTQTIVYNGQTSSEEKNIIICPVWLMIIIIVALSTIISLITALLIKKYRRKRIPAANSM